MGGRRPKEKREKRDRQDSRSRRWLRKMVPKNAAWLKMSCATANGPYAVPHQRHPYQSWVGAPVTAIFMNQPEQRKWYVSFKEGGYILPVNRSRRDQITFRLTLDEKDGSIAELSPETGKLLPPAALAGGVVEVSLEAGEGKRFLPGK